eukprot:3033461-Prymnesium_polylepis.1
MGLFFRFYVVRHKQAHNKPTTRAAVHGARVARPTALSRLLRSPTHYPRTRPARIHCMRHDGRPFGDEQRCPVAATVTSIRRSRDSRCDSVVPPTHTGSTPRQVCDSRPLSPGRIPHTTYHNPVRPPSRKS